MSPYRLCWCKILKIAPNGNHTFSCIPLWILEDIKAYIKKSANRKANVNSSEVPISKVTMKDDRNPCQSGPLRVAVLGAGEVGKSALTVRYLTKRFIGEYRSDTGKDQNELLTCFLYISPLFSEAKDWISRTIQRDHFYLAIFIRNPRIELVAGNAVQTLKVTMEDRLTQTWCRSKSCNINFITVFFYPKWFRLSPL